MSKDRTPFGQRMFDARKYAKLTQEQVAERLGLAQSTVAGLEKVAYKSVNLVAFAALYNVESEWLALGDGPMTRADAPPEAEPTYSKRANDIASAFDDLKGKISNAERQAIYSRIMATLQMAKAGQKLSLDPPAGDLPSPSSPMSHQPALEPTPAPQRGR